MKEVILTGEQIMHNLFSNRIASQSQIKSLLPWKAL